jgi:hypothetical protein
MKLKGQRETSLVSSQLKGDAFVSGSLFVRMSGKADRSNIKGAKVPFLLLLETHEIVGCIRNL